MQATAKMRETDPGFPDPMIYADYLQEEGQDAQAWVLRHPGTVGRKGTAKAIAEAVGYNGRKIRLEAKDLGQLVELWSNYWDEGSRSYWFTYRAGSAQRFPDGHPVYNRVVPPVQMTSETILVEHQIHRGKDIGIRIYATPETLRQLFS